MFRKDEKGAGAALRLTPGESAISIIGAGMRVVGDITTDGTVRIEGRVEGTIRAGKAVVLGKEGEVQGNILTQDAVIGGRVTGFIVAESRLELQSTSVIEGEIRARAEHLQLDEGARFNGKIQMLEGEEPLPALPPARAHAAPEASPSSQTPLPPLPELGPFPSASAEPSDEATKSGKPGAKG